MAAHIFESLSHRSNIALACFGAQSKSIRAHPSHHPKLRHHHHSPPPHQTYTFRGTKLLSPRHQTITHNNNQIYTVEASSFWFKPPILTLHASNSTSPILAAAKIGAMGWGLSILPGDPADKTRTSSGKPPWTRLRRISQWKTAFYFYHEGKTYLWKRTRKPNLSAENAKRGTRSFKLIETAEAGSGRVVMVVSWESTWKPSREMLLDPGRVLFYEKVGRELEVLALVAVLGTVYRIRRNETYAVAASGGGGGG